MEFRNLKAYLRQMIQEQSTPGVDCIVYQDHKLLFRYFDGLADVEARREITGDGLYLIFSMTKMLTCTAALQLLEQGKYELDDPVAKYLPEFAAMRVADRDFDVEAAARIATGRAAGETGATHGKGWAKSAITVRHLFSMAAGLDYDLNAPGIRKAVAEGKTSTREIAGALAETVLGFEPGTRFRYSLCHDVLGALIETWSGVSFGTYLKEHIFDPLGMKDTFFGAPDSENRQNRMMALYRAYGAENPRREPLNNPFAITGDYESGGAGLTSCAEDYGLFLDALACGGIGKNGARILSEGSVALMRTNQMVGQQVEDFHQLREGYGYGLGVRVHEDPASSGSLSPVGEFGWDGAAGAFSLVDPVNHISLAYFQHVLEWDLEIQKGIRNALYQDLAEMRKPNETI